MSHAALPVIDCSPTKVETFDLCARKAYYKWVSKVLVERKESLEFGDAVHDVALAWLSLGAPPPETDAGRVFKQGIKHLPPPSPEYSVDGHGAALGGRFTLDLEGGVAMHGTMDLLVPPHLNGGKPLVLDHKSTKDLRWAKTVDELRKDPQATTYAVAAMELTGVGMADLRWVYYAHRNGKPSGTKAVALSHTVASVTEAWGRVRASAAGYAAMVRAAPTKPDEVEPDPTACGAYGGCEYREVCPIPKGAFLGAHLKRFDRLHKTSGSDTMPGPATEETKMSLADVIAKAKGAAGATKTAPAAPAAKKETAPTAPAPAARGSLLENIRKMQAESGAKSVNPPPGREVQTITAKDVATIVAPAPKPAANGKAKPAPAPESAPAKPFVLLLDCYPVKGRDSVHLVDLILPAMREAAEAGGQPHWALAEFNKGPAFLAAAVSALFDAEPFGGFLTVDTSTPEARAVLNVLVARADVVVRGMR